MSLFVMLCLAVIVLLTLGVAIALLRRRPGG